MDITIKTANYAIIFAMPSRLHWKGQKMPQLNTLKYSSSFNLELLQHRHKTREDLSKQEE